MKHGVEGPQHVQMVDPLAVFPVIMRKNAGRSCQPFQLQGLVRKVHRNCCHERATGGIHDFRDAKIMNTPCCPVPPFSFTVLWMMRGLGGV
jgi:hypothetical protein